MLHKLPQLKEYLDIIHSRYNIDDTGLREIENNITPENIQKYREKWLRKGAKWFAENEKPEHWDRDEQMKNIPIEFK